MTIPKEEVITGAFKGVEFTDKQIKVTIQEPGSGGGPDGKRWPATFSGFLDQIPEHVQVALRDAHTDATWSITVREGTKLNSKGNPYRNLVSAIPGQAPRTDNPAIQESDEYWDNFEDYEGMMPDDGVPAVIPDSLLPQEEYHDPRDPQNAPVSPNKGIVVEGVVQGHLEKLAVDLYVQLRKEGWDEGLDINYVQIRILRDSLYHNLKNKPIMPQGYCYLHEVGRNLDSKKRWYHKDGENYCMPEGIFNAEGEQVDGNDA